MTFTVSIRDSGGHLKSFEIEAPDRASVFRELSARKLSAISVTESKGKSRKGIGQSKRSLSFLFWFICILILTTTAVLVYKFVILQPGKTRVQTKEKKAKVTKATTIPKVVKPVQDVPPTNVAEKTTAEKLMEGKDPEHWIVIKGRDGKEFLSKRSIPGRRRSKPPLYKHAALNALDAILFKDAADPLIGVRVDERFMESYVKAIVEGVKIEKDDSKDVVKRKQGMIEALQQINEAIKAGGSLEDIVNDALKQRRSLAEFKAQMKQERKAMRLNGESDEAISDFEKACNKMLVEKGAKPLLTKETMKENLEMQKAKKEKP